MLRLLAVSRVAAATGSTRHFARAALLSNQPQHHHVVRSYLTVAAVPQAPQQLRAPVDTAVVVPSHHRLTSRTRILRVWPSMLVSRRSFTTSDAPSTSSTPTRSPSTKRARSDAAGTGIALADIEAVYQKKTPIEHILLRPDSYVGSIQPTVSEAWVVAAAGDGGNKAGAMFERRRVTYVPGLLKIFDEILVNAADNYQRNPNKMTELRVDYDAKSSTISVWNNGPGIPVANHAKEGVWVPEMVLGQLLTGSNFDDSSSKVTGGRNGYGAKLTNIFSSSFTVETVDTARKLHYKQTWTNNMHNKEEPIITPLVDNVSGDYTKVTFSPDLKLFRLESLRDDDFLALLERRVFDIAGCNEQLNVFLNGQSIRTSFQDYALKHLTPPSADEAAAAAAAASGEAATMTSLVFERINERWQVGVAVSDTHQFQQVSFVNSVNTSNGGTHVAYVAEQVAKAVADKMNVPAAIVRNNLFVFVNCLIENPSFASQSKDTLTTKAKDFGSECRLPAKFVRELLEHTSLCANVKDWVTMRDAADMRRLSAKRSRRSLQIAKLDDANLAATKRASECTLILTEGDSAKALAVAGLSVVGRDLYGVYPLRGKMLNVEGATATKLANNAEIADIVQILGLDFDKQYKTLEERSQLRYGRVMLMTDQDHDGSHIKGLFINFMHRYWPELLRQDSILTEFITPIVKATHGAKTREFFSIVEYNRWRAATPPAEQRSWRIKYYKGLGTSTSEEGRAYFKRLDRHCKHLVWDQDAERSLHVAFQPDKSAQRKLWISAQYSADRIADRSGARVPISEFVNNDLVQFSHANLARAIPSVIDGLKPSQRKVLFACFRRERGASSGKMAEVKVAQLAAYCSEHTSYHHGEASLANAIVKMAQDYVGSNNVPLLLPIGQFGTRLQGGEDCASARYIFTRLNPVTRAIFPEADDALLNYLDDDGTLIEPEYYVPIVPLALVNSPSGIGTGWSTNVPPYNPLNIIDNLERLLDDREMLPMVPWVRGFKGTITQVDDETFMSEGVIEKTDAHTLRITELPLHTWTNAYKEFLESKWVGSEQEAGKARVRAVRAKHTEQAVDFVLEVRGGSMAVLEQRDLLKEFKLRSPIKTSNMVLFHPDGIREYASPLEIIRDFYPVRLEFYGKRKAHLEQLLAREIRVLQNRFRFCELVSNGKLLLVNRAKADVLADLEASGIEPLASGAEEAPSFDYLLNSPISSLTRERLERLTNDKNTKENELLELQKQTPVAMWREDLKALRKALAKFL